MAERTKTGVIALIVVLVLAGAAGVGYLIYQAQIAQREAAALDKIRVFANERSAVGRSYARSLEGIEALRAQFRNLLVQNSQLPPSRLAALRDETTLAVIEANGLGGDLDAVLTYVAELEACIASRRCDAVIATGHQSPLTALRHWEQWYRPYVDRRRAEAPDVASGFYGYVGRPEAAPAVS